MDLMNLNGGIETHRKLKDGRDLSGLEMIDLMILGEDMRWSQERGGGDTC